MIIVVSRPRDQPTTQYKASLINPHLDGTKNVR